MLGLVFTELMRFIELRHSADVLDVAGLDHDGAYTAVGNYPHQEALRLASAVAKVTEVDESELLLSFGRHLFERFRVIHPEFFVAGVDPYAFLEHVQHHIHLEVRKLHAEARPPSITTVREGENLVVGYRSHRPMALLAQGLIEGCIASYQSNLRVTNEGLDVPDGYAARFTLSPTGA